MARLRRREPVRVANDDAPVVLMRRMRRCGQCSEATDWCLEGEGSLCVECLELEGVKVPAGRRYW